MNAIAVSVKYLASLTETLQKDNELVNLPSPLSIEALWQKLNPDIAMPANTLCAIDHEYAMPSDIIETNCELAFFPPVTGG